MSSVPGYVGEPLKVYRGMKSDTFPSLRLVIPPHHDVNCKPCLLRSTNLRLDPSCLAQQLKVLQNAPNSTESTATEAS